MKTKILFIAAMMMAVFAQSANAISLQATSTGNSPETYATLEDSEENPVDVNPEYPGGTQALFDFLYQNIKFPKADQKKGVNAIVVVRFTVEKDGSIDKIEVIKHGTPSMDKESIRVMKLMPKWVPGKKNGEPVAVSVSLPVHFKVK